MVRHISISSQPHRVITWTCDICNVISQKKLKKCDLCGKHVCKDHKRHIHIETGGSQDQNNPDYTSITLTLCLEHFSEIKNKLDTLLTTFLESFKTHD